MCLWTILIMKKRILDVGCGYKKLPGTIGIDLTCGDVIHDLNKFPYPFKAKSFDKIYSRHCLEHLEYFEEVVDEFYRLLKDKGMMEIIVPYFAGFGAHHPTHKRFFNYNSFDPFIKTKDNRWLIKSKSKFKVKEISYHFYPKAFKTKHDLLFRIFYFLPGKFANAFPLFYQRFVANIIPAYEIKFIICVKR
jgi:SAM-dependent methyltransferase